MKSILYIDENADIRNNIFEILELLNYKVITAESGKAGLEIALKENPDLILSDIVMPEVDGYAVLHALKNNPVTANIPFIFITGKAEKSDLKKGLDAGADDYITKPFTVYKLIHAIESVLKKQSY
jgi:CRP/FNR family cyclic AMP-dependent transcriptional regulator